MEFTHSTLNDLMDRIPRPSGVLYLSQDIDPTRWSRTWLHATENHGP
ncbi:hypothetical protein ACFT8P_12845 [Streptomyces sp. NPDC057101]